MRRTLIPCLTALLLLGGCDWFRGSPTLREPIQTGPSQVDLERQQDQLTQATDLADEGDYDTALIVLHDILKDDPTSTPAYLGIGDIYLQKKDYRRAEPAYGRAARLEPRNYDAQFGHAVVLQMLGRLVEAVKAYHRALTIEPESSEANRNLAITYLQMDEPNHAIVFAEKAVEVDPSDGVAWVNLGASYERVERWGDAADAYVSASERMEPTPELMSNLMNMLVRQKRYREVVNIADTIQKFRDDANALERKGWALFRLGEYDASDRAYRAAVAIDPQEWQAFNGIGVTALNRWLLSDRTDTESWNEAQASFRASLRINRDQDKVVRLMLDYGMSR
ncbi:MAG: hypothetical protein CMJ24_11520 [Phycisphaerae bacterium]|nr:hypothetical protein [Phycisphaerae bacterium]MDG1898717.1 tetratricopeptide repeat protein [Phycisphaerales bacterium]|tara:strand:- start:263 stop:1273 length:1011 start_codon:yes stop_codon:yes gene_type:complete